MRPCHAYERATSWRDGRPKLPAGGSAPHIDSGSAHDIPVTLNDETRALVETMARRAGLELPPTQLALLLETAPYGLELVRRIRRDLPWSAGPANPFKLDS